MALPSPSPRERHGLISRYLAQRQTAPHPIISTPLPPLESRVSPDAPTVVDSLLKSAPATPPPKKRFTTLYFVMALILSLAIGLYFLWRPSSTATTTPPITQQNFGPSSNGTSSADTTSRSTTSNGGIQVYIVGAVKHPGVYILATNARVYQLLQAAGGPLPDANLVALNLVARLSDGQEIYVTRQGEQPPSYMGGVPAPGPTTSDTNTNTTASLVNINTADATEMEQQLHISSTTAAEIINYRTQHGDFTSVDQLSAAVSKTIYDKIKGLVTV
jgi:competence protein ComEA